MTKSGIMGKKIPTIFGLMILIGGLVAGIILVNSRQGLDTKAGPTESPKNVKLSNISATTFSVSWTTDIPLTGFIKYSDNPAKINLPAGDVRDQISGTSQSYTNHHANVTGLSAGKTYYFLIGSGSQTYDDNGKPFQVRTGPQVISSPEDVVFGKIVNGTGTPTNGAIVYVEAEGGQTLSTMTKADGAWRLNLASSRDKEGKVLTYDPVKTLLSIFVQAGSVGTATAITDLSKAKPVEDIVLGKNQSFVDAGALLLNNGSSEQTATDSASQTQAGRTGFQNLAALADATAATGEAKIVYPAIDGELIATSSPQFRGVALPNSTVKITVQSDPMYVDSATTDAIGEWRWSPPSPLEVGAHTITVEYTDNKNVLQVLTRGFTILSSADGQGIPAFTATPSATPIVTPTEAPTPTEIFIMPATESGELVDAGTLSSTIILILGGVALVVFGKLSRRWTD